jgi:mRNA interferase RelE/StbE
MPKKYSIAYTKSVLKFLARHPDIAERLYEKLIIMTDDPLDPSLDVVPYIGHAGSYRMRIGKYRFLFAIIDEDLVIYFYDADSRGGIYK